MAEPKPSSDAAAFAAHWEYVGPIMEKIRRRELRSQQQADQAEVVDALLAAGLSANQENSCSSQAVCGFVELRRLLHKADNERTL